MEKVIFLTNRCNQNCFFCFKPADIGSRPLADIRREIDECADQGIESLTFSGGEPSLYKNFLRAVKHAGSLGFRSISLQTNAIRFTDPDIARALKEAGATVVQTPLHSPSPKISDAMTQAPGTWQKTVNGILNLHAVGLRVTMNTVVNSVNYKQLPALPPFIASSFPFVRDLAISIVNPDGQALVNRWIVPKHSDIAPFVIRAHTLCEQLGVASRNPDCGMPVCFLKGAERFSDDFNRFANTNTSDVEKRLIQESNTSHKIKGPNCSRCVHDKLCDGVWKGYSQIHGLEELVPITDE